MLCDLVRVGAVVRMRVRDFCEHEKTSWLVLREKGGRQRRLPALHIVREYIRAYLDAAGLGRREHAGAPLFQSSPGAAIKLSGRPIDRSSVLSIVKRLCQQVGLPSSICNHAFRATGITLHQENGGDIETAARLTGHADTRTTQLYNRSRPILGGVDVEKIRLQPVRAGRRGQVFAGPVGAGQVDRAVPAGMPVLLRRPAAGVDDPGREFGPLAPVQLAGPLDLNSRRGVDLVGE